MTRDFLPEYRAFPTGNGDFFASYVLFDGSREKLVPGRRAYPNERQAREAAKEYLRPHLNPPLQADQPKPLGQEITEYIRWKQDKEAQATAERDRVFGAEGPAFARNRSGRLATVEYRNRRRA